MKSKIIFVIYFLACVSCISKTKEEIYQKNADEFLSQFFLNFDTDYCVIPPHKINLIDYKKGFISQLDSSDLKKEIMSSLSLTHENQIDNQLELSESFLFNKQVLNQKTKIINRTVFENSEKELGYWDNMSHFLETKCPQGLIKISKPLFNQDYTKAIFYTESIGGGSMIAFKLENGKWKEIKSILNWIS
jgi:hypothetical protein